MDVDVTITNWTTSSFPLGCYCAPETLYTSPFYNLSAGNTYNFGTLAFFNIQAGLTPDEGLYQPTYIFTGNYSLNGSTPTSPFGNGNIELPGSVYSCGYGYGAGPGSPQANYPPKYRESINRKPFRCTW